MSLWSVVRCDRCATSTSPCETDGDASELAASLAWGQRKVNPRGNMTGKGIIDLCQRCKNLGEQA